MSPAIEPRAWFEVWRDSRKFFRAAMQSVESIPLTKAIPQHIRDAYVMGLFARIWNDHRPCEVRLIPAPQRFPDGQLREGDSTLDFEITLADRRDRRMFDEHRQWAAMYARGQLRKPLSRAARHRHAREAIPRVCAKKAKRYGPGAAASANLLISLNLGPVLSVDEMVRLTRPWESTFASIWLLCGTDAVQTWPTRLVRRATTDPFA